MEEKHLTILINIKNNKSIKSINNDKHKHKAINKN